MSLLLDVALFLRNTYAIIKTTPTQKVVLYALAARIGKNKDCWLRQYELAQECQISKRQLIRELNVLSDLKIIKVQKSSTKKGKQNHYSVDKTTLDIVTSMSPSQYDTWCHPCHLHGVGRCHPCHLPVDEKPLVSPVAVELQPIEIPLKVTIKNKTTIRTKERKRKIEILSLPEWLPSKDWNEYLEYRRSMKCPMGEIAQKRAINALTKFHESGQDIARIIDQSIVNGWKGLFPLKGGNVNANGQAGNGLTHRQATTQRAWDTIKNWQ